MAGGADGRPLHRIGAGHEYQRGGGGDLRSGHDPPAHHGALGEFRNYPLSAQRGGELYERRSAAGQVRRRRQRGAALECRHVHAPVVRPARHHAECARPARLRAGELDHRRGAANLHEPVGPWWHVRQLCLCRPEPGGGRRRDPRPGDRSRGHGRTGRRGQLPHAGARRRSQARLDLRRDDHLARRHQRLRLVGHGGGRGPGRAAPPGLGSRLRRAAPPARAVRPPRPRPTRQRG